jgi:hypothetical protein
VKPELEECVLRSFRILNFDSQLPDSPADLRRILNLPNEKRPEVFRQELADAHEKARTRRLQVFTSQLEAVVKRILEGP